MSSVLCGAENGGVGFTLTIKQLYLPANQITAVSFEKTLPLLLFMMPTVSALGWKRIPKS